MFIGIQNEKPCGKTTGYLKNRIGYCHSCESRNPEKNKRLDSASSAE
jgi:hypothetical protein